MFGDLKNIIIAVAITAVVVGFASSSITWKYTSSHYKEIIATAKEEAATALQEATDKVLLAERKNNDITAELNKKSLEHDKQLAAAQTELDRYRTVNRGLLVSARSCSAKAATPNSPATSAATAPAETSGWVCELSELLSTRLTETLIAADELRSRAEICKSYSEAINKQREEMSKNE